MPKRSESKGESDTSSKLTELTPLIELESDTDRSSVMQSKKGSDFPSNVPSPKPMAMIIKSKTKLFDQGFKRKSPLVGDAQSGGPNLKNGLSYDNYLNSTNK